jgi:hypothetical protein
MLSTIKMSKRNHSPQSHPPKPANPERDKDPPANEALTERDVRAARRDANKDPHKEPPLDPKRFEWEPKDDRYNLIDPVEAREKAKNARNDSYEHKSMWPDVGDIDYTKINNNGSPEGHRLNKMKGPELDSYLLWLGHGNEIEVVNRYGGGYIWISKPDLETNLVDALRNINYGMCRNINALITCRMPKMGYHEDTTGLENTIHAFQLETMVLENKWRRMQDKFCQFTEDQDWSTLLKMMNDATVRTVLVQASPTQISEDHIKFTVNLLGDKIRMYADDGLPSPHATKDQNEPSGPFFAGSNNRQLVRDITNSIMAVLTLAD